MGKKILLDTSPTGVQHSIEIDDDGNSFTAVEYTPTRVENEILDSCAAMRSVSQRNGGGLRHAGRIPINTYMQWKKEWREKYAQDFTWPTFEAMKLNSRDNQHLRTGHKRSGSMKL